MIIYLLESNLDISPLDQKVATFELGGENLVDRLTRQFKKFLIKKIHHRDEVSEFPHLLIHDNTFLTDLMAQKILKRILTNPNQNILFQIKRNNQSAINLITNDIVDLGVSYHMDLKIPQSFVFDSSHDFNIDTRLPKEIYHHQKIKIKFSPHTGVQIQNWIDLLTAHSIYVRELTSSLCHTLSIFLSKKLIKKIVQHPRLSTWGNKIGKNCVIHPTAIIEGSVIGDDVEIGPFCYIRSSYIENGATIREGSSVKLSYIDSNAFTMPCDFFNTYIGQNTCVFTSIIHNTYIGSECFIGGGTGFSDYDFQHQEVLLQRNNQSSKQRFLGSVVGPGSKIGAGMIFKAGLELPAGTTIFNNEMISQAPEDKEQFYIKNKDKLILIPKQFIQSSLS